MSFQFTDKEKKEIEIAQRLSFYESLNNAWIDNRMEVTKTFITISAAGIGLFVGLINDTKPLDALLNSSSKIAVAGFAITIVLSMLIYLLNPKYLQHIIRNHLAYLDLNDCKSYVMEKTLNFLFYLVIISFFTSVIATAVFYFHRIS